MDVKSSLLFLLPILLLLPSSHATLTVGFYSTSCPPVEIIVRSIVAAAVIENPGIAAGLIRLHFHDCFVRGCDASVLLRSANGTAERDAIPNASLRGFEVIDSAKAQLEAACPNTVSCADILAFAARDSAAFVGDTDYVIPAGRRDGSISIDTEALSNLPSPTSTLAELINAFAAKNLTELDMVTLSGAHSIGVAGCGSFSNRLFNFSSTSQVDPTLDPDYAAFLLSRCPNDTATAKVNLDSITPDVLDNNYYLGLTRNLGLLTSDQALLTTTTSTAMVMENVYNPSRWARLFTQSMVKMGAIQVLTGTQGEIRRNCNVVNPTAVDLLLPKPTETSQVASS
ncbi:Peroxidase 5 [Nymphaea thermarum]|nr:Peroxidase 5 [Nymphaea thermarum]